MASYYKTGNSFTVVFRLKGGKRQYLYGIKTLKLAKQAKAKKEIEEQLSRAGLVDIDPAAARASAAARKSISEHIGRFERELLNKGDTEQHAQQQTAHVHRLLAMAKISSIRDLALEPVQDALYRLRGPKCGARTCNAARQAVIQFERFLRRHGNVSHAVLQDLSRFDEKQDIRRQRRALSQEEVDWLLTTTSTSKDGNGRRCGITPADRAVLYAVGLGTGFRQRALLSLGKASFFIDETLECPFVRLAGQFNKNRRPRDQQIPRELAALIRDWLSTRPEEGPVWRPLPHARLSLRFRRDMEAARTAWIADAVSDEHRAAREKSNTLKYVYFNGVRNIWADFHGLRHTGISFVVRESGLNVGQKWADHSTPVLTSRYVHVENEDMTEAMSGVPDVGAGFRRMEERRHTSG